jgi:hypothetical protein
MQTKSFARKPNGGVEIDVCFHCHAMWFDQFESAQLAPGSIIQLFRDIHEHRDEPAREIPPDSKCPRCPAKLALTQDIQRTNRITYYRCPSGHGRLTTFFQFLREKNFVRTVTEPEMQALRAQVKQVRCSSCGGPIDLVNQTACPYCKAPVSILDPEAVSRTLKELDSQERKAGNLDVERLRQMVAVAGTASPDGGRTPWRPPPRETGFWDDSAAKTLGAVVLGAGVVDLLSAALEHLIDD